MKRNSWRTFALSLCGGIVGLEVAELGIVKGILFGLGLIIIFLIIVLIYNMIFHKEE